MKQDASLQSIFIMITCAACYSCVGHHTYYYHRNQYYAYDFNCYYNYHNDYHCYDRCFFIVASILIIIGMILIIRIIIVSVISINIIAIITVAILIVIIIIIRLYEAGCSSVKHIYYNCMCSILFLCRAFYLLL